MEMDNSLDYSMNQTQGLSQFLRLCFAACAILLAPLRIIGWLLYDPAKPLDNQPLLLGLNVSLTAADIAAPLDLHQRLWAMGSSILPTALGILIFSLLSRLFRLYQRGDIFTADAVAVIRWLGWTIIAAQLVDPAYQMLNSAALTWHNPVGSRQLNFSVNFTHLELLFTGLIVIVVSRIMDEGRRLQVEQDLTI